MLRVCLAILTALVIAVFLQPRLGFADQSLEENVDRPGLDFQNFDVNPPVPGQFGGTVDSCRIACEQNATCKAWTHVAPGLQGPKARCWLKNAIPSPVANNCCVSGVPMRAFEPSVDRPTGDFKNFDLSSADPNQCSSACSAEGNRCKAWTFVRPGVQGPNARCWLKEAVPPAFTNDCCVSGVMPPIVP